MSVSAYILVQTDVGRSGAVVADCNQISGVVEAEQVMGSYDVIVKASADTLEALTTTVVSAVQQIPGITRTLTCPVIRF